MLAISLCTLFIGACARTVVRPESRMREVGLPRPQQIVVYDFAVTESEVAEEPIKKMLYERSAASEDERQREIGQQVAKALAEELVKGLRGLGFDVEQKPRGTPAEKHELLIDGRFIDADEGNRLGRIMIGFGVGASRLDTEVDVYYGPRGRKVLDFKTHTDSGKLPGAAAAMGLVPSYREASRPVGWRPVRLQAP